MMNTVFIVAAVWNFWGGLNYLVFNKKQAMDMGYPRGNRWESLYIAIMAFVFGALYAYMYFYRPEGYLNFVPFFAAAKILIGLSAVYCVQRHGMPVKFAFVFGGGNTVIGFLLLAFLFTAWN